jgi:Pyruvate:ferredoxin oxidoreductase and related 2-oxoacid:ferredoxin oxidoreductases, beta subunit
MNTGIQRSSSTPHFADTTTTPYGAVIPGKTQRKKDLTKIMVAHNIPYAAQSTFIGNFSDLCTKAHKAIYTPGPAFLNVMSPCPRGWRYPSEKMMLVTKAAVESCVWPLYEVVDGKYILNYKPKTKLPITEYLKMQGRFAHMPP